MYLPHPHFPEVGKARLPDVYATHAPAAVAHVAFDMTSTDAPMQIPPPTVDEDNSLAAAPGAATAGDCELQVAASHDFSVTLEVQILNLPPKGQLAAMLRFSSPDVSQVKNHTFEYLPSILALNLVHFERLVCSKLLDNILLL